MNDLPVKITNYLRVNRLVDYELAYLIVSIEGNIIDLGTSATCCSIVMKVGNKIQESMTMLEPLFPLTTDNYLPNVLMPNGLLVNLHLIKNEDLVWMFAQKNISNPVPEIHGNLSNCEQLLKAKLQLQDLLNLKEQFVNTISHDFRSPLATIIEGLTIVQTNQKSQGALNNADKDILEHVINELLQLLNYTNKLYNWTQLNINTDESKQEEVSLSQLISDIEMNLFVRLKQKNIEIVKSFDTEIQITTDCSLFSLALQNVVDNALKFSPSNTQIVVEATSEYIKIIDSGEGISNDIINQIGKGYLIKSRKRTGKGVGPGLGLNIVTRILKVLDYTFDIHSIEGKGTSFTIKLS